MGEGIRDGGMQMQSQNKTEFLFYFLELSIFETQNKTRSFCHMQFFLACVNKVANDSNKCDEKKNNSLIRRTSENASISHCAQTSIYYTQHRTHSLTHIRRSEKFHNVLTGWAYEIGYRLATNVGCASAFAFNLLRMPLLVLPLLLLLLSMSPSSFCRFVNVWDCCFSPDSVGMPSHSPVCGISRERIVLECYCLLCHFCVVCAALVFVRVWVSSFVWWILREHIGANTHTHIYNIRAASMCVGKQYCVFGAVDDANEIVLW